MHVGDGDGDGGDGNTSGLLTVSADVAAGVPEELPEELPGYGCGSPPGDSPSYRRQPAAAQVGQPLLTGRSTSDCGGVRPCQGAASWIGLTA